MTPSPWNAVLFDLDGTIADTIPLILACYREMMLEHFGHEGDPEAWLRTVGRPLPVTLREIASSEAQALALRRTYKRVQEGLHDEMVRSFEGIPEIVHRELERGSCQAIVTSKGAPMTRRTLDACGVADAFSVVITADDVHRPKPHAEPVHRALDRLGVTASRRVVFIGDSVHDIEAGHAAGVTTIAVTWGALDREALEAARPTHLVEAPTELQTILEGS
ncbi:MAG: HAD-IA family hydrolase [Longimicrobiales bacterium]|nr:HAD-IA family hydrolase [Longimicrobiales bacterium]